MQNAALELIQLIPDSYHLSFFAERQLNWLVSDLNRSDEAVPDFTESRAKALLRASDLLDDPTRHSFERLVEQETGARIALHDLLNDSELAENDEVLALVSTTAASTLSAPPEDVKWLALAVAAFAWKSGLICLRKSTFFECAVGSLANPDGENAVRLSSRKKQLME